MGFAGFDLGGCCPRPTPSSRRGRRGMPRRQPLLDVNSYFFGYLFGGLEKMNRTLILGIAIFLAVVGIAMIGGEKQAIAGHGCSCDCSDDCSACDNDCSCKCKGRHRCSGRDRCCGKKERCCGKKERCHGRCKGRSHGRCKGRCKGCSAPACNGCAA
jgi:hypothetical protein